MSQPGYIVKDIYDAINSVSTPYWQNNGERVSLTLSKDVAEDADNVWHHGPGIGEKSFLEGLKTWEWLDITVTEDRDGLIKASLIK